MKQNLLILAMASATLLPSTIVSAADHTDGPQVYGRVDLGLARVDEGADPMFELQDKGSRLGFKGEEDLGGLTGIYQLEFAVDVAEGSGVAKSRDSFIGLKGDFGTLMAGRFDTPFKKAQGKSDLFSDHYDMKNYLGGEEREANILGYKSPSFGAISVFGAILPGEGSTDNTGEVQDGIGDGFSVMAKYEADGLFAAVGYDMNVEWSFWGNLDGTPYGTAAGTDALRLAAGIKMDTMGANILFQSAEQSDITNPAEQTAMVLSGYTMMDQTKFEIQYGMSSHEQSGNVTEIDADFLGLGVEQKMSKRTTLYALLAMQSLEDQTGAEIEKDVAMIGAQHKF